MNFASGAAFEEGVFNRRAGCILGAMLTSLAAPRQRSVAALLLTLAACDSGAADPPTDAEPTRSDAVFDTAVALIGERLEPLVLGTWGANDDDVWFVGGAANGGDRFVAHFDGDAVRSVAAPTGAALWWIWGADTDRLWACGDAGAMIARRDGTWRTEDSGLDDKAILWGVWGSGADDLWAVGGSYRRGGPKAVVLRSSGDGAWHRLEDPVLAALEADEINLFKVWGRGPNDVHLIGERGTALHWDGRALQRAETPVDDLLFTVHGHADGPVLAVGGLRNAVIIRWDGRRWVDDGVGTVEHPLNGVFVRDDGTALAAGAAGVYLERDLDGAWHPLAHPAAAGGGRNTIHAIWANRWAWTVGGEMQRGLNGFIATDRNPRPSMALDEPPVTDAGTMVDATRNDGGSPDAGPSDARTRDSTEAFDARPRDIGQPDTRDAIALDAVAIDATSPDTSNLDTALRDAALRDTALRDTALPDATPMDVAASDAFVPPGPGELCPPLPCADGLECLMIFDDDLREIGFFCIEPCAPDTPCPDAYGPGACCIAPGPQLFQPYCVPRELFGAECP